MKPTFGGLSFANQSNENKCLPLKSFSAKIHVRNNLGKSVYLTHREIEVMKEIAKGNSAKESARILNVSPRTIESCVTQVKLKLNLQKTIQVVSILQLNNLL